MASATTSAARLLVLGGGPAGAAASRLLASWGHRVHLITRPTSEPRLAVSLPPSCAKLFDAIGIADSIENAGFVRSTGNTVWWGGDARVEPFADGARGWQVDLGMLEDFLLRDASRAGVSIERRVVHPDRVPAGSAFVLDCTGRAGVVARQQNARRHDEGPRTIALAGQWRSRSWPVFAESAAGHCSDGTHTVVESYGDGWMWSVPTSPEVRHVSAMIDPQRSALARGGHARDVYLAEIAKTTAFKRLLADAELVAGPSGWDASTYGAHLYAADNWLLVGDAGSFIDPLSSAGVKKALASAWLAAVAVHTCVGKPSMHRAALQFYSAREHEIERHYAAESRAFLTSAARGHGRPFWADRSNDPVEADRDSDSVRQAFEELKRSGALRVVVGPGLRIDPRPLVEGHEIVLAPHLVPAGGEPIRYLCGVDLVALLELAPAASQVPDLFGAYVRRCQPVSLHDFLLALSTAVARRWLVSQ